MPQVSPGALAGLAKRVKQAIGSGDAATGELVQRASKQKLFAMIGELGREGAGPLFNLVRDAGLDPVLQSLPPDAGVFFKAVIGSGMPRAHALRFTVNPSDPGLALPGVDRYSPSGWQSELHLSQARYRIVCCGRRAGKSFAAAAELKEAALCNPGAVVWYVAPVYATAERVFGLLQRSLPGPVIKRVSLSKLRLELVNGSVCEFKSAEIPDNLRGEGLALLILDEAARIAGDCWRAVLRPALADKRGRLLAISTPAGRGGWFFELFQRGQDPLESEYQSFSFPSWSNLIVFPKGAADPEIASLRASLPSDLFRQECEAVFIQDGGVVFRGLSACLRGPELPGDFPCTIHEPDPKRTYYLGCDLARLADFSTVLVLDDAGVLCFIDRLNKTSWRSIRERIIKAAVRYNSCVVCLDGTGVGDSQIEELEKARLRLQVVRFTNTVKNDLVSNLQVAIENGEITLPRFAPLLVELEAFALELTPSGKVTFNAPSGMNDDLVSGLMLACHAWRRADVPYSQIGPMMFDAFPGGGDRRRSVLDGPREEDFGDD
jgi:hypothetical protein